MLPGATAQFGFHRVQQRLCCIGRAATGREPELDVSKGGVGRHRWILRLEQISHLLSQVGFTDAAETQQTAHEHPCGSSVIPKPWFRCGLEHRPHLRGHAREGEDGEIRQGGPDHAGGRAQRIGQHIRTTREEGLTAIAWRHRSTPCRKLGLNLLPQLRTFLQRRLECRCQGFGGEVIRCRTKTTGGDQNTTAPTRLPGCCSQPLAVITDHGLAVMGESEGRQSFGNPTGIAVENVSQKQLRADAENFDTGFSHGVRSRR